MKTLKLILLSLISISIIAQELDPEFLDSLPDDIRKDLEEKNERQNLSVDETYRPYLYSSKLSQVEELLSLKDKIHGFRIKFKDLFDANYLSWEVLMDLEDYTNQILISENWTLTYGPLFEAIMMEKTLVGLLVFLIVLVAAFNIV